MYGNKTEKLLIIFRNGTHRGKGGAADQSIYGRMGLGTACKEETSKVKNVSIESFGGKELCFGVKGNWVFTEKLKNNKFNCKMLVLFR
jgi:hypothetical protein